jgi:hypothetical protein
VTLRAAGTFLARRSLGRRASKVADQHHGCHRNHIENLGLARQTDTDTAKLARVVPFDVTGFGDLRAAVLMRRCRDYAALGVVQCLRKRHSAGNDQRPAAGAAQTCAHHHNYANRSGPVLPRGGFQPKTCPVAACQSGIFCALGWLTFARQLQQLGDVGGDPPRLVIAEHLGRRTPASLTGRSAFISEFPVSQSLPRTADYALSLIVLSSECR